MKVFSFVAPSDIATFESDIKPFFTHITNTQGFPASQQNLICKCTSAPCPFSSAANLVSNTPVCNSLPVRHGTFHWK